MANHPVANFHSQRPSVMGGTLGAAGASIASAGSAVS
jgi:hypothetical protein